MPSLKEKKRYLVFEVLSEKKLSQDDIIDSINKACLEFMGVLHHGKAGILILKNQFSDNKGIIKVNNKYVDYLKASLMLIKEIRKTKVNVMVIGISGILKKANDKYMKKRVK